MSEPRAKKKTAKRKATIPPKGNGAYRMGLRFEMRQAKTLPRHPLNWRKHTEAQKSAVRALLERVGWAGALIFNEQTGHLIDGHLRKGQVKPTDEVPCLIGNWTEEEEHLMLATLDPTTMMAIPDGKILQTLLKQVKTKNADLLALLDELRLRTQFDSSGLLDGFGKELDKVSGTTAVTFDFPVAEAVIVKAALKKDGKQRVAARIVKMLTPRPKRKGAK